MESHRVGHDWSDLAAAANSICKLIFHWGVFASMFMSAIGQVFFFFLIMSFSGLGNESKAGLIGWVSIYSAALLKKTERTGIISFLSVYKNSTVNPSEPSAFCFGRLLIID